MPTQQQIADAIAQKARQVAFKGQLFDDDVVKINELAATLYKKFLGAVAAVTPVSSVVVPIAANPNDPLTLRTALELIGHEAIVLEWYLDSEGNGTWSVGITNKSGINVDQYKDNPQTVEHCLEAYVQRLRRVYVPAVLRAFAGFALTEAQFAAALIFEYNTGAIEKTNWVPMVKAGQLTAARKFLEGHYLNGGALTSRRAAEAELFFEGKWSGNGYTTIWPVKKPGYHPDWAHPQRVDVRVPTAQALAAVPA